MHLQTVTKLLKHLQGKHPQKLHAGSKGKVSIPAKHKSALPEGDYESVWNGSIKKTAVNKAKKLGPGHAAIRVN